MAEGAPLAPFSSRVRDLERIARRLDPRREQLESMWSAVGGNVLHAASHRSDQPAYAAAPDVIPPFTIDDEPTGIGEALSALEAVNSTGINQASGGHFAFIPGGGVFPAALGDLFADVGNAYAGVNFAAPAAAALERSLVGWMADLLSYPDSAGGDLTSGASVAHLEAIVTAREAADVASADAATAVVYLTTETHHCIEKAVRVAGLASCVVRHVDVDARRRMRPERLDAIVRDDRRSGLRPWLVVATAGTIDAGAVDPLDGIADVADEHELWLHVDAAYGGFFILVEHGRRLLSGIGRSQSAVLDPHKGLFLPFGSGALVVRDEKQLAQAHRYSATYLADARASSGFSASDLSVELSRPFRGPRLWLPLKLYGLAAFRAALEEKLLLAHYLHTRLAEMPGWEVGPEPDLSVVTYRYIPQRGDPDEFNRRLLEGVLRDGRTVISATEIDGTYTLRAGILHYRSHLEHVDTLIEVLEAEATRLEAT